MSKDRSRTERETIKVLYAGYLPAFGSVGTHPQFHCLTNPPPGYEFVHISSGNLWRITHLLRSSAKLFLSAVRNGAKPDEVMRFISTRDIRSQLQIPTSSRLAFLPTYPYILGQVPWVIEIEDTTTLFTPFLWNGQTSSLEIWDAPYYPAVKALLESDSCRGIVCHVKSTAESIPLLFNNAALHKKTTYIPLGISLPPTLPLPQKRDDNMIRILFTNSWKPGRRNFYLRGGLDLLEAFSILASRYPNLRLILRTALPPDLDSRYLKIIESCRIEVVDRFLLIDDLQELMSNVDIYVLPSARIHVVSILEAMAHGLAVVASDGWGIEEYVEDGRNGIIVRGRYGKCSWMDANGMLREDYKPLFSSDPFVVSGLVDSLSTLIEDRELREVLGQAARRDIETRFSIDNWNRGLAEVFDQALHDEATDTYNVRNMWGHIFKNMGFDGKGLLGNVWKLAYFWFWFFNETIKGIIRKILSPKFVMLIKSIASRLHINLQSRFIVRIVHYIYLKQSGKKAPS